MGYRTLEGPELTGEHRLEVILAATNGLDTIELGKRLKPHLLLLGVSMPLASGAEFLVDLHRCSPDTKIVVMTAVASAGVRRSGCPLLALRAVPFVLLALIVSQSLKFSRGQGAGKVEALQHVASQLTQDLNTFF